VPRYVEEWLRGQAAGGYVEYDPGTGEYFLTEEQASMLADPSGPADVPGAFELALALLRSEPRIAEVFRSGAGLGWSEHDGQVVDGYARLHRPWYERYLVAAWLPALDGVAAKLTRGARVADVACGQAAQTMLMARAFPRSSFLGLDGHEASVARARAAVAEAGLGDRVRVEIRCAHELIGGPYDLVTIFDALHAMGDPVGVARRVAEQLAPDGTWMIVEPFAGATVAENLTPLGRVQYALSMFVAVPNALSQEGGYSLGAQAGGEPIRRLVTAAGFSRFRLAATGPFCAVYEARP
jgi:2-polyprenyl-3-methyl-5-hydroxy-6-metoxy-1,4-benzoquinol methylase